MTTMKPNISGDVKVNFAIWHTAIFY